MWHEVDPGNSVICPSGKISNTDKLFNYDKCPRKHEQNRNYPEYKITNKKRPDLFPSDSKLPQAKRQCRRL